MIGMALASLRHRLAAFVATFLAVLIGSALLVACGGLFESAIRLSAAPQRLAGAPLLVTGPEGFKLPDEESETVPYAERSGVDGARLAEIRALPGVAKAVPDVSFPAVVPGAGGTVLSGHDWSSAELTPYTLRDGTAPGPGDVVLDAATARAAAAGPGDRIDLLVAGKPRSFTVSGVTEPARHVTATAMFFDSTDVPRRGTVPVVGVFPEDGTQAADIAARLPAGVSAYTGDDRGTAEFSGIAASRLPLILLSAIFGGMVIVVMALVVWATINLSTRQRQRELALLRATGATPWQVNRLVVVETMAVAGLAVICGIVLGRLVGGWIFDLTAARGVVPPELEFRHGPIPFAAGALLGLLAPWLAARFAARAAGRTRPVQALVEASIPPATIGPLRRLLALIFAAGTLLLALTTVFFDPETAAATGGPAALTGAIAVALYGPELVVMLLDRTDALIRRVARRNGQLAALNSRARAVQFAAVLTPVTLATAIAFSNVYSQTTQDDARLDVAVEQFQSDAVITSDGGGIAPDLLAEVRATPGVDAASALVFSRGWIEEPYDGHGSDPSPLVGLDTGEVLATPVTQGSLRDLTGDTVALPADQAEELGLGVGSKVVLRLGDGARAAVTVVAILDSPTYFGSVVLPASLLAPHTTSGLPSHVLVRSAGGDVVSALQGLPGVSVGGPSVLAEQFAEQLSVAAWISYLLAGLALAYAAIASVNTLAVAMLSRRREFAAQRLAGATRRQVLRMLYVEAGMIAVAGVVLGAAISLCTVVPIAIVVGVVIPSGPLWVLPAVIGAVLLIVYPVTLVCARLAMRRAAIHGIST